MLGKAHLRCLVHEGNVLSGKEVKCGVSMELLQHKCSCSKFLSSLIFSDMGGFENLPHFQILCVLAAFTCLLH